eukprot:g64136.t1
MEALGKARNDNERMLMRERARQFPPPYAIAREEKKAIGTASTVPGGGNEDQTGPDVVIRRHRQQKGTEAPAGRMVGAWNEMGTTITVGMDGGEGPTTEMGNEVDGEEEEEEKKPPNTPIDNGPTSRKGDWTFEVSTALPKQRRWEE